MTSSTEFLAEDSFLASPELISWGAESSFSSDASLGSADGKN